MKVTEIRTFFVDPGVTVEPGDTKNWLLVRIETDEGIRGWGECHTLLDRERSIAAYVDHVGNYLVGRNPLNIKHFTKFDNGFLRTHNSHIVIIKMFTSRYLMVKRLKWLPLATDNTH